jgi:hypothetical protein
MFDLHRLGWHNFQELCSTVTRELFGQTAVSFLSVNDGGRDGAFYGTWAPKNGDMSLNGSFVVQCKHYSKANASFRPSDLTDELPKIRKLVQKGRCDNYILMTNGHLSGTAEEALHTAVRGVGVKVFLAYGYEWLCQQIREHKRLRMLVPRLYGLGDLSQILDDRAYAQAQALLESLQEDLSKFVVTAVYHRAAVAVADRGFVLLKGEPAAGKTSIAASLAMAAIDQWGCSTVKIISPAEIHHHWNPHEPTQLFWIDDAFGIGQYESALALAWNHLFPEVNAAIRKGARFVMTSRDYIYNAARRDLKVSIFPLLDESQVVIDVHQLTLEERRHILYNHLKLGEQQKKFLTSIKPYLDDVVHHRRFAPETARRLGHPLFTTKLAITKNGLMDFVERREHLLAEVVAGVENDSRAALALIYMEGGELRSPIVLTEASEAAVARLGSDLGGSVRALEALNDSLVRYIRREGNHYWIFKHPTIGDAFADLVLANPELMGIYLAGAPLDRLMSQVTCGEVGIQKAVIIPRALFGTVLDRLFGGKTQLQFEIRGFLATRCDPVFLSRYVELDTQILETLRVPQGYIDRLLGFAFYEAGLLPEAIRADLVQTLVDNVVSGQDMFLLEQSERRRMLTSGENQSLRTRIRDELVPDLNEVRQGWEDSSTEDPEQHMGGFFELLDLVQMEFSEDNELQPLLDRQRDRAGEWISERLSELGENLPDYGDLGDERAYSRSAIGDRSIFDDVDL